MPDTLPQRWELDLYHREAEAAGEAPLDIGDRVVITGAAHHGSLIVFEIAQHPGGGWRAGANHQNLSTWLDAAMLVRVPADFEEPPTVPAGSVRYGLSDADEVCVREQDWADPEYQRRWAEWQEAFAQWQAKWGKL